MPYVWPNAAIDASAIRPAKLQHRKVAMIPPTPAGLKAEPERESDPPRVPALGCDSPERCVGLSTGVVVIRQAGVRVARVEVVDDVIRRHLELNRPAPFLPHSEFFVYVDVPVLET